jgi:glucose dehydrogenase
MLGRLWRTSLLFPFLVCAQSKDWSHYHGSPANTKYSPLKQINTANVSQLKPAWVFDTNLTGGVRPERVEVDTISGLGVVRVQFIVSGSGKFKITALSCTD